ncbi:MAG: hypothetical protein K940chlam7_00562 [Chlamydiae bacterium]|nr:hypothetical protein [Chlamydiota bacterium]
MKPETENKLFETAEAAIAEAVKAIPETESDNLLAALQAYYETGGELEDFYDTLITAFEDTFEVATEGPPETENQYFLIGEGEIKPCTENDIEAQEYDIETDIPVKVSPCESESEAWNIESTDWYSGEGICRLTINSFPLQTSLRIFGDLVKAFTKAESENPENDSGKPIEPGAGAIG